MSNGVPAFQESRVSPAAHGLYRQLIDAFLDAGAVPDGLDAARLAELASEDWLALDASGQVSVLYPFSLSPSGIEVSVGGVRRHAMCAIDALGIPAMLDTDVEIVARCPVSGERLGIQAGATVVTSSSPAGIVVVRRRQGGAAHVSRCAATRFFRSAEDAAAWVSSDGQDGDVILTLDDAFNEARLVFGRAYSEGIRMTIPD